MTPIGVVMTAELTGALGGADPNPAYMAGGGRAVQCGKLHKSAWRVALARFLAPRLQRLIRCAVGRRKALDAERQP